MALYHLVIVQEGAPRVEVRVEDAVLAQFAVDFVTPPTPQVQIYAIKVGNVRGGYVDGYLAFNWTVPPLRATSYPVTEETLSL